MLISLLLAAATLQVDPGSGNNKFDATFDAPLGEKIVATSSAVACDLAYDEKSGLATGSCSVPLVSIMVDNEPTKTEHFQQWATNKKGEPRQCAIEAQLAGVSVKPAALSQTPGKISGEAAFTVCGKSREGGGKEKITGTAMKLADGRIRLRVHVDKFSRDRYRIGPKYTEGWLSRVQQLAPVVADAGTLDIALFAQASETKSVAKP